MLVRSVVSLGPVRLVLATRNAHKVREFSDLLAGLCEVVPLPAEVCLPPETGETFAVNALTKARAASMATGTPAAADDSGIVVEALGGAPGVRSARFAGPDASDEDNLRALEEAMAYRSDRRACYVSALAFVSDGGMERLFEGRCAGRLTHERRGVRGFGYDPIFVPGVAGCDGRTMAELADAEKNAISHRGKAVEQLAAFLRSMESGVDAPS